MDSVFTCLRCGLTVEEHMGDISSQVRKCHQCGREMYRQSEASDSSHVVLHRGGVQVTTARPSRYAGSVSADEVLDYEAQNVKADFNPVILPRTPFVVILGFILSFIFPLGGLILSLIGLNLVRNSAAGVRGRGLAIAGIIISLVSMLAVVIALAVG